MAVPILAYHQIVDDDFDIARVPVGERPYHLPLSAFEEQMDFLSEGGYPVLSLESLADALRNSQFGIRNSEYSALRTPHSALRSHAVVITFDDGHVSNFTHALPVLRERNLTATFFVVTGRIGQKDWLDWSQLREMQSQGMTIGSHTVSHPFLSQLSENEMRWELEQSKKTLDGGLETPITTFAVPYGFVPTPLGKMAADCGYRVVCNSHLGLIDANADALRLPRLTIRRGCSLDAFAKMVQGHFLTMFKLKTFELLKNVGKKGLSLQRWLAVREFLLKVRGLR